LSSSLTAVLAQRLVRVLCGHCKEDYAPADAEQMVFGGKAPKRLFRGRGCDKCLKTGYSGQTGIFEFMHVDNDMRPVILKHPDSTTIRKYAASRGMRTLREDGLDKAVAGITTLEEVIRVAEND
ncbi:MAG: type II secretion system protein GspE, partial [Deltaproteobacteria bacterium]